VREKRRMLLKRPMRSGVTKREDQTFGTPMRRDVTQ